MKYIRNYHFYIKALTILQQFPNGHLSRKADTISILILTTLYK